MNELLDTCFARGCEAVCSQDSGTNWYCCNTVGDCPTAAGPPSGELENCQTRHCNSTCPWNGEWHCCNCSLSPVPTNNNPNSLVTVSVHLLFMSLSDLSEQM